MAIKTKVTDLRPARERYSRKMQLLSGGLINGQFFENGQITIYPWDNQVDEWLAAKLRKGAIKGRTILFNVLPQVCDLNGCTLDKFISSEVMSVLMVARAILRNDTVTFEAECPHCGHKAENSLKIPDQLERTGEKKLGWPGYDLVVLPECSDEVKVRPITVGEEIAILDRTEHLRQMCSDSAARVIAGLVAINDSQPDDAREAVTWFKALPPGDQDYLLEQFDNSQPGLSQKVTIKCDDCGKEFDYTLQLNEDFFRRPRLPSGGGKVANNVRPSVQEQGPAARPAQVSGASSTKASPAPRRVSS